MRGQPQSMILNREEGLLQILLEELLMMSEAC